MLCVQFTDITVLAVLRANNTITFLSDPFAAPVIMTTFAVFFFYVAQTFFHLLPLNYFILSMYRNVAEALSR